MGWLGLSWAFWISMGFCALGGVYRGLQDRFGPNVIEGYREYKEEMRYWEVATRESELLKIELKALESRKQWDEFFGLQEAAHALVAERHRQFGNCLYFRRPVITFAAVKQKMLNRRRFIADSDSTDCMSIVRGLQSRLAAD